MRLKYLSEAATEISSWIELRCFPNRGILAPAQTRHFDIRNAGKKRLGGLVTDSYEEEQRILDPHRGEEQRRAREEMQDRLQSRGIQLHSRDGDEDAEDLLDAIERFETAVEAHGGDLLMDRIGSSEPTDSAFVLPIRDSEENIGDYRLRIEAAIDQLRHRHRT
jgi:hypothetical protein